MVNATTPLLIIGAALPRTGTTSVRLALERLGYRVFHPTTMSPAMVNITTQLAVADHAGDTQQRATQVEAFVKQLSLEGFHATLDQPSCFLYRDLISHYPEAKVLQTLRSSPAKWAHSMVEMAYGMDVYGWKPPFRSSPEAVTSAFGRWSKEQLGIGLDEVHREGVPSPRDAIEARSSVSYATAAQAYINYQQQVLEYVPADKLVTFGDHQWEPLCRHFYAALPKKGTSPCQEAGRRFQEEAFPIEENSGEKEYLLQWVRRAQLRTTLYAVHPVLDQPWLIHTLVIVAEHRGTLAVATLGVLLFVVIKGRKSR